MDREQAIRRLEKLRRRREDLRDEQRSAAEELTNVMQGALNAGMTLTEVSRLAGVSRQGAYKLLGR